MIEFIKKSDILLFFLAWAFDTVENLFLLYFFNVPFGKPSITLSIVFALVFVMGYKLINMWRKGNV